MGRGLFDFWLRFGSVTGGAQPAPSPKPRHKSKILPPRRYVIDVNALISEVASRQVPVAHDKGRGPLLARHDGCPTGIDKVVAGALTKKRRRRLARKRSHVLNGRLETTVRPVHRPFRTNSLGRVTRHWRVWLGERFHQCCSAAPRPNGEGSF